ncbi:MAG: hypothetical protein IKL20_04675 [Alistipes sp.]|nr:hypothetical protein [Alistipes sp.]
MESTIYKLSDEDYAALASEIKGRLLSPCYFTGVVETKGVSGEILRLTASLILYRRRPDNRNKYERQDTICGVSAVWWDFLCEDDEGVILDDFDFEQFTKHLIEEA